MGSKVLPGEGRLDCYKRSSKLYHYDTECINKMKSILLLEKRIVGPGQQSAAGEGLVRTANNRLERGGWICSAKCSFFSNIVFAKLKNYLIANPQE